MKRKTNILFIILILSSLFLILTPKSVKGSINDIIYTFENDVLFDSNPFNQLSNFNLRNPTEYTVEYNSSYFIPSDNVGSEPKGWIDTSTGTTTAESYEYIDGHNSTLRVVDNDGAGAVDINQFLDNSQDFGTVEFWFRTTDITKSSYIKFEDSGTNCFVIHIQTSTWKYNFGPTIPNVNNPINNQWYRLTVHFELTGGGYKGLAQYRFEVIINSISSGALVLISNENEITDIVITTNFVHSGYTTYSDAFGYSWLSNYSIGNNFLPIIITDTTTLVVDRYEFGMIDIDTFHSTGDDNPNGWTDIEVPGGDKVGIAIQGNVNGLVYSSSNVFNDERGISKEFDLSGTFINISIGFIADTLDAFVNVIYFHIYSSDTSLITSIRIVADLDIAYKDHEGFYHDLTSDIVLGRLYDFNIFINYELDRVFLILKENDVIIETIDYSTIEVLKEGIEDIEIFSLNNGNDDVSYLIDYVGLYIEGVSQVGLNEDFGLSTLLLVGVSDWNYEHNNLFNIIANGNFHLGVVDGVYSRASTLLVLKDTFNYTSTETSFLNLYDGFISEISVPRLVFTLVSDLFNVSNIKIDGCKLIQNSNEYFLQYSHSGIDTNESYFYVDINNRLQFSLTSNDTDTEYIQATFDIPNLSSTDRAISFRGSIIDLAFGYFAVDYLIGVSTLEIPIFEKTTRAILPTNKTIDNFIVLITDNDVDAIIGTTTGFVSQPKLLAVSGIGLPIITAGLIEMMIPIIMIIIPTLLISKGFGKEGNKLIIPLFFIFSIVATATLIIPVWILFIIIFGTALFLARNKQIGIDK